MIGLAFGHHPQTAANTVRFADRGPLGEGLRASRLTGGGALKKAHDRRPFRGITLAHGVKAAAIVERGARAFEIRHLQLERRFVDDPVAIGA